MLNGLMARASARVLPRALVPAALAVTCLAVTWYLAPRTSQRELTFMAAALAGLVLLQHPLWGLLALIPASLVVPFSVGTGTQTEVPVSLLLLGLLLGIWVLEMVRQRSIRLAPSPANLPWIALIAVGGLSIVTGGALWNPFVQASGRFPVVQLAQWAVFIFSAGAFWLVGNLVDDLRWLRWLTGLFLGLGALHMVLRLVPGGDPLVDRLFSRGGQGSVFWVWLVALSTGQAVFNRGLHRLVRLGLAALAGATLFVATYGGAMEWVSGWAPPLIAILVVVWLRSRRWGALLTGGMALVVALNYGFFYQNVLATALQTGSFLRFDAADGIIRLVGNRWLIGLGLAAYVFYWNDLIGYWVYSPTNIVQLTSTSRVNSHNNYMDIYAQMGLLGLAAFVWLVVALWQQCWQVRRGSVDGFEQGYVNGCLGGLAGMLFSGMLGDWILPFVYNIGLAGTRASALGWLFLGGVVAISQVKRAAPHGL